MSEQHPALFFEDLPVGRRFVSPPETIDETVLAAYRATVGGLAGDEIPPLAIAAISMRLLLMSPFRAAEGVLGAGVQKLEWPARARIGDVVHAEIEVVEARRSKSRPDRGLITTLNRTVTGAGLVVQTVMPTIILPARTAA